MHVSSSRELWFSKYTISCLHLRAWHLQVVPGNDIVLVTIEGTNPELKSVLLNSHYDVVPVFPVSKFIL